MSNLFTSIPNEYLTKEYTYSTRAVEDTLDILKEQQVHTNCSDAVLGDDTCALLLDSGAYNYNY